MKVLITGGRSELAQGMVEKLLTEGHDISVTASTAESVDDVKEIYKSQNVKVLEYNLSKPDELSSEMRTYLEEECDALILNAATKVEKLKLFHHLKKEDIQQSLESDVLGNCVLIQNALTGMIKKKNGRIIFISSTTSIMGTSRYGLYSLTKNALEGLILNLAIDYGKHNIQANIIRPGLMQTQRTKRFWEREGYLDKVSKLVPSARMGQPADIANMVKCLLEKDCYINGEAINVSGGLPRFRTEGVL
jgi:3-oxoacyl-[acyl-carrier protein] reductase